MKKIENSFVVTGFLGKDAEIREFTNASVARFPLAVSRQEKNGEAKATHDRLGSRLQKRNTVRPERRSPHRNVPVKSGQERETTYREGVVSVSKKGK